MKRVVVVCPGRGAYGHPQLGSLAKLAPDCRGLLERAERERRARGRTLLRELDGQSQFRRALHMAGENASALTFVLSAMDWMRVQKSPDLDVVAVVGNSLGWYTSLFVGGCLAFEDLLSIVETTGGFQAAGQVGAQLVYPILDDSWTTDVGSSVVQAALARASKNGLAVPSVRLGGLAVLAADQQALPALMQALPPITRGALQYPLKLTGHSAFHSPLMEPMAASAQAVGTAFSWRAPVIAMVDGRGHSWRPISSDPKSLAHYTLHTQIVETYDFHASLRVALREYAPDSIILLGPGKQLSGALGQICAIESWGGVRGKSDFKRIQGSQTPLVQSI